MNVYNKQLTTSNYEVLAKLYIFFKMQDCDLGIQCCLKMILYTIVAAALYQSLP